MQCQILPIIFREKIDIVEDEAIKVVHLHRFDETDVHQS